MSKIEDDKIKLEEMVENYKKLEQRVLALELSVSYLQWSQEDIIAATRVSKDEHG